MFFFSFKKALFFFKKNTSRTPKLTFLRFFLSKMVLKSGVLAAFFSQFFPFITSDGRLLRQLAVCYITLARSVNVLYVYNSNLFYYIILKVKLVNLKSTLSV